MAKITFIHIGKNNIIGKMKCGTMKGVINRKLILLKMDLNNSDANIEITIDTNPCKIVHIKYEDNRPNDELIYKIQSRILGDTFSP